MRINSFLTFLAFNCSFSCAVLGQSSFALRNHYGVDAPVYDSLGIPLAGEQYRAELWGSATPDSLTPLVDINQGFMRMIVPFGTAGYFSSGTSYLSVRTVTPFGWAWLQVRAWDARLGATYEEVAGLAIGGYGESPLFHAQGGNPLLIPASLPGLLIGLQSFSLQPVVPEPSTWALLASGGTALWWAMRRQRQRRP